MAHGHALVAVVTPNVLVHSQCCLCVWDMRPFRWPEPYARAPIYRMEPIFSDLLLSPISLGLLLSLAALQCLHASFCSRNSLLHYFARYYSLLFSPLPDIQLKSTQ